ARVRAGSGLRRAGCRARIRGRSRREGRCVVRARAEARRSRDQKAVLFVDRFGIVARRQQAILRFGNAPLRHVRAMRTKISAIDTETASPAAPPVEGRARALTLAAAFLGWMFDGVEMGIFPLVARPALLELQVSSGAIGELYVQTWMGRITAGFLLGAAVGGVVFGWLGDRVGRVRAMMLSVLAYSLFTGLNYFVTDPWQLVALRFIAALGMGGEWSLGVALVMEVWPRERQPLMAALIGVASCLGYALIALAGIFADITEHSWRWVMLLGMLPALLAIFIRWFVPESERWQAAVARDGPGRPLREIFSPALRGRTALGIALATVPLVVTWGIVLWIPLWADQLTGGREPRVKAWCLLAISLGAAVGAFIAPLLDRWLARRTVYVVLCAGSLAACSLLFRAFTDYGSGFLVVVGIVGVFTSSFYGWLPQYLPELFPTRVRATAQGISYNFGRVITAVGAWQMGALMAFFDGSYAAAGAAVVFVYLLGAACVWLAPETRGQPLPS
ncbi:MAG: MFS transporter, partial [Opitutaceae bacterium]|nr:MFS transporter [Opitutaceae bacterium]